MGLLYGKCQVQNWCRASVGLITHPSLVADWSSIWPQKVHMKSATGTDSLLSSQIHSHRVSNPRVSLPDRARHDIPLSCCSEKEKMVPCKGTKRFVTRHNHDILALSLKKASTSPPQLMASPLWRWLSYSFPKAIILKVPPTENVDVSINRLYRELLSHVGTMERRHSA